MHFALIQLSAGREITVTVSHDVVNKMLSKRHMNIKRHTINSIVFFNLLSLESMTEQKLILGQADRLIYSFPIL